MLTYPARIGRFCTRKSPGGEMAATLDLGSSVERRASSTLALGTNLINKNKMWDINKKKEVDPPERVKIFLKEYEELCRRHNVSISHEDQHGGFIIEAYSDDNIDCLKSGFTSLNE